MNIDEGVVDVEGRRQRLLAMERGDSAAALVQRTDDGCVLLTRQFRYPAYVRGSGYVLEVPAGRIDPDETPEAAIRRELVEELGYEPDRLRSIASFFVSPGGTTETIHLFHADVSEAGHVDGGGGLEEEAESIEIVELSVEAFRAAFDTGELLDAKTLIAASWFFASR